MKTLKNKNNLLKLDISNNSKSALHLSHLFRIWGEMGHVNR